ncbi:hypothetical protein N431DRAFT_465587 [Stipitochalara longipes BDJ]|nr:hypothetical protein N431DRAFT_465587 [Stipitochalara longipes BDJ]
MSKNRCLKQWEGKYFETKSQGSELIFVRASRASRLHRLSYFLLPSTPIKLRRWRNLTIVGCTQAALVAAKSNANTLNLIPSNSTRRKSFTRASG